MTLSWDDLQFFLAVAREGQLSRAARLLGTFLRWMQDRPDGVFPNNWFSTHDDGRVVLLRQYRHPVGRYLWELPAGLCDVPGEAPVGPSPRQRSCGRRGRRQRPPCPLVSSWFPDAPTVVGGGAGWGPRRAT